MENSATSKPALSVRHRAPDEPRMLSFGQERLWYLDQLAPGSAVYNTCFLVRLRGPLDTAALQRALESVVQRHEVLRTAFLSAGGRPVAVVPQKRAVELKQIDLRPLGNGERETETARLIRAEAARPFNLARDLMFRASLLRVAEEEFLLLCIAHHMVFEGGSVAILFRDLAAFYGAAIAGTTPELRPLPADYFDFSLWQRRSLNDERFQALNAYWKRQLADAPPVDLPLDFSRPAVHTLRGAKYYFDFPPELFAAAEEFFRANGTTSYRALCAAFVVLLHCYTGLNDICLGTPCTPRCRGIEDLIGFFVNTVVLRVELTDASTFRKLIRKVDAALFGAMAHSDLPFHKVVDAVQPARDPSRHPLFQINFRAPQQPYPRLELPGITADPVEVLDNGTSKFDLALEISAFVEGANYIEYCSDLFRKQTVARMTQDFQNLLRALLAQPDTELARLPVVGELKQHFRPQTTGASL